MKVPLLDLGPQIRPLRDEIVEAVTGVIDSTRYILGPEVEKLEAILADYCQTTYSVGVSSGTDALVMTMMAMDIGAGDLVVTTPYTFFATVGSILRLGARPVFVDIEAESFNMDPAALETLLERLKRKGIAASAILPVHLFGQCADMGRILAVADRYGVPVIEDAAQAIGAWCPVADSGGTVTWRRAGSLGLAGCFSFFPSKNLGGVGDGGLVTTSDFSLLEILRSCRNHGAMPKYYHKRLGGNFRLDPIQAVVLMVKFRHLEQWHTQRRENAENYRKLFHEAGLTPEPLTLPRESFRDMEGASRHNHHIYNQFVIRTPKRDQLRDYLIGRDIGCEIYYPLCLHQQQCVPEFNGQFFPVAEQAARETLALPIYPGLTMKQQAYVVARIKEFFQSAC